MLLRALADENASVRKAARTALDASPSQWRDHKSVPELRQRLLESLSSSEPTQSAAAACALAVLGDPTCVSRLIALLGDSTATEAEEALTRLGPTAHSGLRRALADVRPIVRQRALGLFHRLGEDTVVESALLEDEDQGVRAEAARLAAEEAAGVSFRALALAVADPAPEVRLRVGQALGRFDGEGPIQKLIELAADENPEVQKTSESLLHRKDSEWQCLPAARACVPMLISKMGHREELVRTAAVRLVGAIVCADSGHP